MLKREDGSAISSATIQALRKMARSGLGMQPSAVEMSRACRAPWDDLANFYGIPSRCAFCGVSRALHDTPSST